MNDGDWVCADTQCANVNFARRNSCNRCGKEKAAIPPRKKLGHEIGKAAAEKSRGLFGADDWQCGRCGNVNWARRQTCNMCNAPKFGEVEERTGLGGGYNERENVEYKEREESDSEYDEYGRKKKKFRGNEERSTKSKHPLTKDVKDVKEPSKLKVEEEQEEEEDEDDDEEEDGDLSKYDLTGWGDSGDENKEETKNEEEKKKSRSSSSSSSRSSGSSSRSSSSDREDKPKTKRGRSRSRSNSPESKRRRQSSSSSSGSRSPASRSSSKERSQSNSPAPRKKC